jgi:hypothetical protein
MGLEDYRDESGLTICEFSVQIAQSQFDSESSHETRRF